MSRTEDMAALGLAVVVGGAIGDVVGSVFLAAFIAAMILMIRPSIRLGDDAEESE